jgi:hypothetical protein
MAPGDVMPGGIVTLESLGFSAPLCAFYPPLAVQERPAPP